MPEEEQHPVDRVEDSTRFTKDGGAIASSSQSQSQSLQERLVTSAPSDRGPQRPAELPSFGSVYETLSVLGSGGMSVVYKVRHKVINKLLAAKMLQLHLAQDDSQIRRFKAEAKALFSLSHRNIVSVREFDLSDDGKPYLLMDYLEGKALNEELKSKKTLDVSRALNLFIQACDGLEHAHSKGIVHRDIKPSNIILTRDEAGAEVIKLVDFGIAKLTADSTGDTLAALTATGDVFGSPPYMSPEQCSGSPLDARSDLYSLGCVMYEVLSGAPPFQADSAMGVIHKHNTQLAAPIKIPNCDPRLTHRLDEIIFKALEKNPNKRYQSAADLRRDLAELQESTGWRKSTGVYLKYTRTQRRMWQHIRSHPVMFAAGAILISAPLIAVTAAGVIFWQDVIKPLQVPPVLTFNDIDWSVSAPVREKELDYEQKANLGEVIVDRTKMARGNDDVLTILRRQKLADFYMRYGEWDKALEVLNENMNSYKRQIASGNKFDFDQNDIRFAILLTGQGDCYANRGNINKDRDDITARDCYKEAARIYAQKGNNVQDSEAYCLVKLKLARLCLKHGDIPHARMLFDSATENATARDLALRQSGIGDCLMTEGLKASPPEQNKLLQEARAYYSDTIESPTKIDPKRQKFTWIAAGEHKNAAIAVLRIIDTYIAEGEFNKALDEYKENNQVLQKGWMTFTEAQDAEIVRNYAKLLFKAGDYRMAITELHSSRLLVKKD